MACKLFRINIVFCFCLLPVCLFPQQVQFNEAMSSNSTFFDEDGDTPDWFELYNSGNTAIPLEGWMLTDDSEIPAQWVFPSISIAADGYLMLWASDKNRFETGFTRTLITQGDTWLYIRPTGNHSPDWRELNFDPVGWREGPSGFGYADGDDATEVPIGTIAVFMRRKFSIEDVSNIRELILDVDYDDAFIAHINNQEVARANIISGAEFDTEPFTDHEAQIYQNGQPDRFSINNPEQFLQKGENVLTIQVHNISQRSSDLTMIPFLSAIYNSPPENEGMVPPSLLGLNDRFLHTNFKISSEGETLFLFDPDTVLMDSFRVENVPADISIGYPLNSDLFALFDQPTPGLPNGENGAAGIVESEIIFSHPGGPTSEISLALSGEGPDQIIRYTLDATLPSDQSPMYLEPIPIGENTVVRARIYQNGYLPSSVQSRSYLIGANHDLPVLSLISEPDNLFDEQTGMYVSGPNAGNDFPFFGSNFWQDWERPMHVSLYETDGQLGFVLNAGAKIFGGWSRGNAQRSFSIFARKQYGINEIPYQVFPDLPFDNYQALVLRNSGNDWMNTMLRDGALTGLMKGADLEYQSFRPAATYINGRYWGFYNIREKVNEHFLAARYNLDPDEIDLLERNSALIHGDDQAYQDLISFVGVADLENESQYRQVEAQIDIDNYIIYQIAQIYFDNQDWPGNNIKFWRPKDGKWRWILFDTDFGFGIWNRTNYLNNTLAFALEENGPGWPNPPWSTLLLRKLLENQEFRFKFINQFADELNSRFLPNRVTRHIDTLASAISSEIPAHYNRWGRAPQNWAVQIDGMKVFGRSRPSRLKEFIRSQFALNAVHRLNLEIDDATQGYIQLNSLRIEEPNWSGDYFQGVPISIKAIPRPGYAFSHWLGDYNTTESNLSIDMEGPIGLKAHFIKSNEEEEQVVINEINYRSSDGFDVGDWVELHNRSAQTVNISGWELKDNNDDRDYVFPEGTLIEGNGYLVISRSLSNFKALFPDVQNVIGRLDFGFSSQGDAVRIFDQNGELKDIVEYFPDAPWPLEANGQGPTLELKDPSLDNAVPENWAILHEFGSPGISNIDGTTVIPPGEENIHNFRFYPNPFPGRINITFNLSESTHIKLSLLDSRGALVQLLHDEELAPGRHHLVDNLSYVSNGIYLLELVENNSRRSVFKWVKVGE